jgi:hypothetical protein
VTTRRRRHGQNGLASMSTRMSVTAAAS